MEVQRAQPILGPTACDDEAPNKARSGDAQVHLLIDQPPLVEMLEHCPGSLFGEVRGAQQVDPAFHLQLDVLELGGGGLRAHGIATEISLETDSEDRRA